MKKTKYAKFTDRFVDDIIGDPAVQEAHKEFIGALSRECRRRIRAVRDNYPIKIAFEESDDEMVIRIKKPNEED